jgi:hypothetical protein
MFLSRRVAAHKDRIQKESRLARMGREVEDLIASAVAASRMVEAGGIEPPSEGLPPNMTTCLADVLISLLKPPAAGSLGASRFGFQPHPLRQENQPIPLNDALSNPVGEGR